MAAVLALAGCGVPSLVKPFRIDIQQGNYVSQKMVSQLKPGMSKAQVRFLLGTPLITDIFHPERWDYVFYNQPAYGKREERHLIVIFNKEGRLTRLGGDVVASAPTSNAAGAQAKTSASSMDADDK